MVVFLYRHVGKDLGGVRVMFPESLGEIGVDSAVLFLAGDRECEDFGL
jgi:hypothetical protein